jgi:hypothetical protein
MIEISSKGCENCKISPKNFCKKRRFLGIFLEILPAVTKNLKAPLFFPKTHGQICHRQIPLCGTRELFRLTCQLKIFAQKSKAFKQNLCSHFKSFLIQKFKQSYLSCYFKATYLCGKWLFYYGMSIAIMKVDRFKVG